MQWVKQMFWRLPSFCFSFPSYSTQVSLNFDSFPDIFETETCGLYWRIVLWIFSPLLLDSMVNMNILLPLGLILLGSRCESRDIDDDWSSIPALNLLQQFRNGSFNVSEEHLQGLCSILQSLKVLDRVIRMAIEDRRQTFVSQFCIWARCLNVKILGFKKRKGFKYLRPSESDQPKTSAALFQHVLVQSCI